MDKTALKTLVGTPSVTVWSQAQAFHTVAMADVGVVLSLKKLGGEDGLELPSVGGAMLATIKEEAGKAVTLTELQKAVEVLLTGIGSEIAVSVAICRVSEEGLSLVGRGEVAGYLLRGEQLVKLGEAEEMSRGVTGKLIPGDVFCVATEQMIEMIGLVALTNTLAEGKMADEQLAPMIHKEADSSYAAAILGYYGEQVGQSTRIDLLAKLRESWKQPLRVKRQVESPRKINTAVAVAALVFLITMIGFGYVRRARVTSEREYASVREGIEQNLAEAESVADLNPDRARILILQSKQGAAEYNQKMTKEPYKTKAEEMVRLVAEVEQRIFRVDSAKLTPLVELAVLAEGLSADRMYLDPGGTLVFPDLKAERVVGMNIGDKSKVETETKGVGKIEALAFFDKVYYGVSPKGVVRIDPDKETVEVVIESDPLWGEITQIDSYAGNIYLLDKGNSEIWKYPVIADGFGERRRWLGAGISLDLTKLSSMRVTGDIWFTTTSGKLERYSRGVPVEFGMEGFPSLTEDKRLSDPVSLFVTDEEVYVLERGAKRVLVFGQDGKYRAQYVSEEFASARDLAIDKDKGYVLLEGVVKEFEL